MIIATRELGKPNISAGVVTLNIHTPTRVTKDEWKCSYDIIGLDVGDIHDDAFGIDSLQSLVVAIENIRQIITAHRLLWLGYNDIGFPILVPGFINGLTNKVEALIEEEAQKSLGREKERAKERARRHKKR